MKTSANDIQQLNPDSPLVIIGSGLAGWSAAREFRKINTTTQIVMLTADEGDFYAKPALSNAFAQKKEAQQLVTTLADKMASTLNVTIVQNTLVTRIDATTQEVETSEGKFKYSKLILATGARAIRLQMSGDAVNEVISVNSLNDYTELRKKLVHGARVLIIGAGLIGCEFANDLVEGGYEVHVVDPNNSPLISLLPEAASTKLQSTLSEIGVKWNFGTSVKVVDYDDTKGLKVTFANGKSICVDVVLSAVGLRADIEIAQSSGAKCDRGILVDNKLQTSVAHIYALGDNTQYSSESLGGGATRTLPYVMPIMNAAKELAKTLKGNPTEVVFPVMPVVIKTPALPIVISPPTPGIPGSWREIEDGIWNYFDPEKKIQGFLLIGSKTSQRSEQLRRMEQML